MEYWNFKPGQRWKDSHRGLQMRRGRLQVEVVEPEDEVALGLDEGRVGLEVTHEAGLPAHGDVEGLVKEPRKGQGFQLIDSSSFLI